MKKGLLLGLAGATLLAACSADSLGVPLGAIAKSIVFSLPEGALLCITAGDRRVDASLLPSAWGPVGRADADCVRRHSGFAIGGVSPLGFAPAEGAAPPRVLIDPSLWRFPQVWAAAGHEPSTEATRNEARPRARMGRRELQADRRGRAVGSHRSGAAAPSHAGAIAAAGCVFNLDPASLFLTIGDATTGTGAGIDLALPDRPLFTGDLFGQWLFVQPGLNPAGLGATRGLRVQVR